MCFQGRSILEKHISIYTSSDVFWQSHIVGGSARFLLCPTMWSFPSRCSRKCWTVVLPDLHQMISSMCYLEDGILSMLWWSRELGAWWWIHKKVLVCLFVESSFIANISNSLWDRHYDYSLKHRRAFLLASLWAFQVGVSCEDLAPLSQRYREEGEIVTDWLE